jgi:hypothetical protein
MSQLMLRYCLMLLVITTPAMAQDRPLQGGIEENHAAPPPSYPYPAFPGKPQPAPTRPPLRGKVGKNDPLGYKVGSVTVSGYSAADDRITATIGNSHGPGWSVTNAHLKDKTKGSVVAIDGVLCRVANGQDYFVVTKLYTRSGTERSVRAVIYLSTPRTSTDSSPRWDVSQNPAICRG